MRARSLRYAAVALGLFAVTGTAGAAPRSVPCMTDRAGTAPPPLDIVGGELRTTRKALTASLRLTTTDTRTYPPALLLGVQWSFAFQAGGTDYSFTLTRSATDATDEGTFRAGGESGPPPKVVVTGDTIIWTVPRASVGVLKKPGVVFDAFAGMSSMAGSSQDVAISPGVRYHDLAAGCTQA